MCVNLSDRPQTIRSYDFLLVEFAHTCESLGALQCIMDWSMGSTVQDKTKIASGTAGQPRQLHLQLDMWIRS